MPLAPDELRDRYSSAPKAAPYFSQHSYDDLPQVNTNLSDFAATVYAFPFNSLIQIEPEDYDLVFRWRLEQEHAMKAANGGRGMTDTEVAAFVARYMPGYELWKDSMWDVGRGLLWEGSGLRLYYGPEREVTAIAQMG
jgi:pantothenate kinase-related protein Tda10